MSYDSSWLTMKRQQRMLYANKVQHQTALRNQIRGQAIIQNTYRGGMAYSPHFYDMRVGAFETTGAEEELYISSVPTLIPPITIPSEPTDASAVAGNAQATIYFTAPTNTGGGQILSYTAVSNPDNITITGASSPLVVLGLTNGTSYTFTVFATNSAGDSDVSLPTNTIIPVTTPDAPTSLNGTPGITTISITFTNPLSDGGSAITNYQYSTNNGSSYITLSPADTSSPITITGLVSGTTYQIRLRAVNAVGSGTSSSAISVTTLSGPSPPTLTYTLADNGAAYVYFTAGADGGSAITNYEYSLNSGTFVALSPTDTISPIKVSGLTNGTLYTIQLRAITGGGASEASNSLTITPVAPSTATAQLYYDPSNPSSYSGSGTTISNVGSYGPLNGTLTGGVSYISGTASGVLDFNGTNGYISFPTYNFGNTITITGWVYPRSTSNINTLLANAGANQATNGFKTAWNWWNFNSRVLYLEAGNGSAGGARHTVQNLITYNAWQHIAYILDRANQKILFLLNGVPVDMATAIDTVANYGVNQAFNIGAMIGSSYHMNAQLGYVKVFNTLLDVNQIYADYNTSKSRFGL